METELTYTDLYKKIVKENRRLLARMAIVFFSFAIPAILGLFFLPLKIRTASFFPYALVIYFVFLGTLLWKRYLRKLQANEKQYTRLRKEETQGKSLL